MGVMILSSILALVVIAIGVVGCKQAPKDDSGSKVKHTTGKAQPVSPGSREDVLAKLRKLAKSDPPKELQSGAMCYEMAAPPDRAEYVCPTCNEKTLHVSPKGEFGGIPEIVSSDLVTCRRLLGQIKGLNVSLDESAFCKKCNSDAKKPALTLIIDYDDEKPAHRVSPIGSNDLKLLAEFTSGKLTHKDDYDFESPLKKSLKRLEELLGVTLEKTK